VKRAFKTEIPVKERDPWEKYLVEQSTRIIELRKEIEAAEKEIDTIVYDLFDLTADEIELLENSLRGEY